MIHRLLEEVALTVVGTQELRTGGATEGRCHMALVVETLLEARRSKVKSKPGQLSDDEQHTHYR